MLHHGQFTFTDLAPALHQGIGPHPHRGFSPVTFVIQGEVHHRDSRYHSQIAHAGDVQWMHAGSGIVHSERPSDALVKRNGKQEIIQLWINSPAENKMHQPHYQYISRAMMPTFQSADHLIKNQLVAGSYHGQNGPVKTESPLCIIWSEAQKNGQQVYQIQKGFNAMIYVVSGQLDIDNYGIVSKESLVIFEEEGSEIGLSVQSPTTFIILTGAPLNEKVVKSGPYVMNSQTQILEAMRDYQLGKMGILIEE